MNQQGKTGIPNDISWHAKHSVKARDWKFLTTFIKNKNKNLKILDVGCGNGNIMLQLLKMGYENVRGIEYAEFMFKKALQKYPHLKIEQGDAEKLSNFKDSSVDMVISCHVLEHLPHPTLALRETSRVLKKGGYFVLGFPNGYHLNDRLLRQIQLLFYRRCDHLQRFSEKEMRQLLRKHGFEIESINVSKGSLEILKDPRIKKISFFTEGVLYRIARYVYYRDIAYDISAVKR